MSSARHKSALAKANKEIEFLRQRVQLLESQYAVVKQLGMFAAQKCEDLCGEWSGRLVKGVCAPCRDLHKLP